MVKFYRHIQFDGEVSLNVQLDMNTLGTTSPQIKIERNEVRRTWVNTLLGCFQTYPSI